MKLGTSSLVVAAFIGPGTVLTCATAGLGFGYDLGWVLLFATVAVFVLQSYTAGTGILAGKGLGEALREAADTPAKRWATTALIVLGLWIGCAAFETGNLVGAAAGVQAMLGLEGDMRWLVGGCALVAGLLLRLRMRLLIQILAVCVGGMSLTFLATLALAPVDWGSALAGLLQPALPEASPLVAVALVGTTIVTYNLFLHPSAARAYWAGESPRAAWRGELLGMALFIPVGGLISFAILVAGATLAGEGGTVSQVADLAALLEPALGGAAPYLFGAGLLAAGLTSAVTAPLAAAAGIRELFGWPDDPRDPRATAVWLSVVVVGLLFNLTGFSPLAVIVAAQAANGLLLPLIAAFVVYLAYRQQEVRLPRWYLALGVGITLVCAGLGARTLWWVWGAI
ncbi:MAG: divalent metal cation transporter [Rhodothermales bacterium]